MADVRTPQENAALILRAQTEAASLLRRAEKEERAGASGLFLSIEDVRRIAGHLNHLAELKEGEHLEIYRGLVRG